jgi:threonine dehydrogenase-like Zn-dependent dehydrogenase
VRAAVASGGELVVEEVADPVPVRNQVLVASLATGICGSDLHLLERQRQSGSQVAGQRIVLGHEFCAEVIDHGPKTDQVIMRAWPVGARVCANPFVTSGMIVGGAPQHPGALGELLALDTSRLLAVPDGLAPELAALTEPLAVGVRAVNASRRRMRSGPAVVLGCGPIGLAVILALRGTDLRPIIACDPSRPRRALAEAIGADVVSAPDDGTPFASLASLGFVEQAASAMRDNADGEGVTIFECVGRPGVLASTVAAAPRHSHIVVVGVCLEPDRFVPGLAITRELSMDFVLAYSQGELAESLRRIADGVVDPAPLVTATVDLDHTGAALEQLRRGEQVKVVVLQRGTTT